LRLMKKADIDEFYRRLAERNPEPTSELRWNNPYTLLVSVLLSAQTTDKRVNMVTPELFRRYPGAEALANAAQEDVEQVVKSTGFFRNKSKNIIGFARGLMADHDGAVPKTMAELSALPGVGRKTANVILGNAFGLDEGVVVDTHVKRLTTLLGFTKEKTPEKVERDLMVLFPRDRWTLLAHLLIWHGRRVCDAKKPRCEACTLSGLCPSSRV